MSLLRLSASDLLERFASTEPTPGGGSAAALGGALAAALVAMVCRMEKTRTGSEEERARLITALGWATEAGARLRALVDEDAAAYDAVVAAYRLPKATDEDKAARRAAILEAVAGATRVPLDTAEACLVVMRAAREAVAHGNANASSDARTANALAYAGLAGAVLNVETNATGRTDLAPLLDRAQALLTEGASAREA